jgi:uncharacterized membrane protein YjjP (DUF1212 family)
MADTKEILTLAVEIGDVMLRSGAEIYRVEDVVLRILESYQVDEYDVYVISNGIFASANEDREDACSMIRHVPLGSVDLAKIANLNQLARDLCEHRCSIKDAWERLEACKKLVTYKKPVLILGSGIGCAGFCYLFGGHASDAVFAFLIGMLEEMLLLWFAKKKLSRVLSNVFASIFVTFLSILIVLTGIPAMQDKIVIGAIMTLVPGIAFTTSIRDFYNGDYLAGSIHLIDALLTALCIAVGVCISIWVYQQLGGGVLL